jgi:hypothetical protein
MTLSPRSRAFDYAMGLGYHAGIELLACLCLAVKRGAQRLGNLHRLSLLQHNDGHRSFNCQLLAGIENLVVVADGAASQLPDRQPQAERRVEHQHAEEAAFHVHAREIVILAPDIHRPFDAAQKFAFCLLDNLEDAREVQTPSRVGIGPTKTALELYDSRNTHYFLFGEEAGRLAQKQVQLIVMQPVPGVGYVDQTVVFQRFSPPVFFGIARPTL